MTETTNTCIAQDITVVTVPAAIRSAYQALKAAQAAYTVASQAYRAADNALGLDKWQAKQLSHRLTEVRNQYGYDDALTYKYLKGYGLKTNGYGERKVPFITREWVEAYHNLDLADDVRSAASQKYFEFFKVEGAFASETEISKAYRVIVTAILDAELASLA